MIPYMERPLAFDRSVYIGEREDYVIIPPEYTADSSYQIRDIQPDRDGS